MNTFDYNTRCEMAYAAVLMDSISPAKAAKKFDVKIADLLEWLEDDEV